MKSIKNIALSAMLTIGAFSAVTYTSCNKDECKDVVCQNGGTCVDGICQCATGYEGTNCQTQYAEKFKGTWGTTETCSGVAQTPYSITITATSATALQISNLGNYGCTVGGAINWTGNANQPKTFTVNETKCGYTLNANGTFNNDGSITITYTASYLLNGVTTTDNCTATLTK